MVMAYSLEVIKEELPDILGASTLNYFGIYRDHGIPVFNNNIDPITLQTWLTTFKKKSTKSQRTISYNSLLNYYFHLNIMTLPHHKKCQQKIQILIVYIRSSSIPLFRHPTKLWIKMVTFYFWSI